MPAWVQRPRRATDLEPQVGRSHGRASAEDRIMTDRKSQTLIIHYAERPLVRCLNLSFFKDLHLFPVF